MNYMLKPLPGLHIYLDDILNAIRGSEERHRREKGTVLNLQNDNNAAVKSRKCTFFVKEKELLVFRLSNKITVPVDRKIELNNKLKEQEKKSQTSARQSGQ